MAKEITKYDITFYCENGSFKIEECTKGITMEYLNMSIQTLKDAGLGEVKKIVIDKIK